MISILRASCLIEKRSGTTSETLEGTSIDRVGERAKTITNANTCIITVSEGRYISRHLSDRKLPFTRARQMAEIDLSEGTPFNVDDVHICFTETSDSTGSTNYFLIRKGVIDPVIDSLVDAGIRPQSILLKAPDGELQLSLQSLRSVHPVFVRRTWPQKLLIASLVLVVLSGILTFGHVYYRYAQADEKLAAQVDEKQKAALEVRKMLDRRAQDIAAVEAARKSKAQAVPVVRVWEELTRILPDTAWITDFTLNGDNLSFSGSAVSAAGLISILDASPLFADPSFTSPVVRVPGQAGERFAIKLSVVRG
ncbi:PilN domain-containing protein [Phyllobacterium myrsinacearum]|uniref:General secretion pathway protein L n=1 Tax=Phyllobacterium myrsinacearum TaxID=28101 RepID=A0A839EPL8_9HYPH|nr:PilN domain-containing protein [Phyllobacterium myrsinacearum]MBA8882021.1 general secretion pathway protein L [Phyllobacterium myrsinacearum]